MAPRAFWAALEGDLVRGAGGTKLRQTPHHAAFEALLAAKRRSQDLPEWRS